MVLTDVKFTKFDYSFLLHMKAKQFKDEGQYNIDYQDIKDYFFNHKWKKLETISMCELIDDIMSLQACDVFDYMQLEVIKNASEKNLDDFNELISK